MRILARLLECEPTVMALFARCPFDASNPPKYMRALLYDYRFRFQYDKEEELKQLCRDNNIRDTTIVEQSEPEEEEEDEDDVVGQFDDILREQQEDEQEEEGEVTQPAQDDTAGISRLAKQGEGEHEITEPEQKAHEHVDEKEAASGKKPPSSEGTSRRTRSDPSEALRSRRGQGVARSNVDERARKAQLARERKLLQALLRGRAPPSKPLKKLVHGTPPEFDEQGHRIWWVRRHLIGPYGPVLAARPRPVPVAADAPAWEQALEPDDED